MKVLVLVHPPAVLVFGFRVNLTPRKGLSTGSTLDEGRSGHLSRRSSGEGNLYLDQGLRGQTCVSRHAAATRANSIPFG